MSDVQDLMPEPQEDEEVVVTTLPVNASDRVIEREYEQGRLRVTQDRNDFFLPHVVDFIKGRQWGNLRPEYQRRLRWDNAKKSRLIESFIMNVPVPPVFLYETSLGAYEVMDGQQRLNTVVEFQEGHFELTGLKIWPSLNGRTFKRLPPLIRRGLERAKISAITLTTDAGVGHDASIDLRAQVFDRLNTGGERLNAQELRNSLYASAFNKMVVELAGHPVFTTAWDIPSYSEHMLSDESPDKELKENNLYKRMLDCEIVLRFFAFRETEYVQGSVKSILDNCMKRNKALGQSDVDDLRFRFIESLETAVRVFGAAAFRLPPNGGRVRGALSRPLYDAVMIAIDSLADRKAAIIENSGAVASATAVLTEPGGEAYDLIVGRANTANALIQRIDKMKATVLAAI